MIKVTDCETFESYLINPDHISAIQKQDHGSKIVMPNNLYFVTESPDQIDDRIDNDYNHRYSSSCHHCSD